MDYDISIIRPQMPNEDIAFKAAGLMVFISLYELPPAAREYGQHHWAAYGLVVGMVIMALSLLLFL